MTRIRPCALPPVTFPQRRRERRHLYSSVCSLASAQARRVTADTAAPALVGIAVGRTEHRVATKSRTNISTRRCRLVPPSRQAVQRGLILAPPPSIPESCRFMCDPPATPRPFHLFLHVTIPRHALHDFTMYHYVSSLSRSSCARWLSALTRPYVFVRTYYHRHWDSCRYSIFTPT